MSKRTYREKAKVRRSSSKRGLTGLAGVVISRSFMRMGLSSVSRISLGGRDETGRIGLNTLRTLPFSLLLLSAVGGRRSTEHVVSGRRAGDVSVCGAIRSGFGVRLCGRRIYAFGRAEGEGGRLRRFHVHAVQNMVVVVRSAVGQCVDVHVDVHVRVRLAVICRSVVHR